MLVQESANPLSGTAPAAYRARYEEVVVAGESADEVARRHREKIARLERSAALWEKGAIGERTTAQVLAALPREEWTVFHDIRWPGRKFANVDHVVIGPPGVFVVDSKNWSGDIRLDGAVLRQNGRSREAAVNGVAEAALAIAQLTTLPPQMVVPVLAFVRDQPVAGWARDVLLCSTVNIVEMLQTRPVVLDSLSRQRVGMEIDVGTRQAIAMSTAVSPARMPRRQSHPSRSREIARARQLTARMRRRRNRQLRRHALQLLAFGIGVLVLMSFLKSQSGH